MNDRLIESSLFILQYERKADTKESYYRIEGNPNILPKRISWGIHAQKIKSDKDHLKRNEINANYNKNEDGFYSGFPSKKIHTSIWKEEDYPEFYGYGILDERYPIKDLLIIYSNNNCQNSFYIYIFKGMGNQDGIKIAFPFLRSYINKKPPLQ